jgi:cation-transporting ATPase 13A3/4/5
MKTPLPFDSFKFSYSKNRKSFLFQGTVVNKCESHNHNDSIRALAIHIGFNTNRGNLIQNILFPKESNFSFFSDIKIFLIGVILIFIFSVSLIVLLHHDFTLKNEDLLIKAINSTFINDFQNYIAYPKNTTNNCIINEAGPSNWNLQILINNSLNILTIVFPPILPISLTFTSFYFHYNLNKKKISCISDQRMSAAGRVNVIVMDKTGTLTEEDLDLYGFQTTRIYSLANEKIIEFDEIERSSKIYNSVHKEFWKRYCTNPDDSFFENYQYNIQNNIIYFLECLATCHSIDKLKGETIGNSIDKKIVDNLNWIQEKSSDMIQDKGKVRDIYIYLININPLYSS